MFEWFKPASLTHAHPLIQGVAKLVGYKQPAIEKTTEQGSAGTASPSTYQFGLLAQRYERQAIITDVRKLLLDDGRAARANRKTAREAVRKGIVVAVGAKDGTADSVATQAQEIIDELNEECQVNDKLFGWAKMLLAEGDLFLQRVVMGDRIIHLKRMPAASMERNTDETDSFPDLQNAFSQFDVVTQSTIAKFSYWQIEHLRWNHIDGERYGESEYVTSRNHGRLLQLEEQSQVVRRMTRAAQKKLHNIGTETDPGTPEKIEEYRARNGLSSNPSAIYDPLTQVLDIYGNGLVDVKTLDGDPNVHEIADLKHFQDVYAVSLGTPKAMIGLDAESINRDVLNGQISEWLKETVSLSDCLSIGLRRIYALALMLKGINPASVTIGIQFSESNMEDASSRADRVTKLRGATIGAGKNAIPDPLISRRTAASIVAEDMGVTDVDAELKAIDEEMQELGVMDMIRAGASQGPGTSEPTSDSVDNRLFDPAAYRVVTVVITDPKGRIFVCKRSPGCVNALEWEVPGGHVEPGETLEAAAVREVKEETGYDVVLGSGMADFDLRDGSGKGLMVRGFLAGGDLKLKRDEHTEGKWIDPQDVSKLPVVPPRFALNVRKTLATPISRASA